MMAAFWSIYLEVRTLPDLSDITEFIFHCYTERSHTRDIKQNKIELKKMPIWARESNSLVFFIGLD